MKFTREPFAPVTIRGIERGFVKIGDTQHAGRVVVSQDRIIDEWQMPDVESLAAEHVAAILAFEPEVVLLGSGWQVRQPANEFLFALARAGVGLETMETGAACRTFNILVAEGRRVVALLETD